MGLEYNRYGDLSFFGISAVWFDVWTNTSYILHIARYKKKKKKKIILNPTEKKYLAYDCELLAINPSVKHFRYLVEGGNPTVYTEQFNYFCFSLNPEKVTLHQFAYLDPIGQCTADKCNISGDENQIADALFAC